MAHAPPQMRAETHSRPGGLGHLVRLMKTSVGPMAAIFEKEYQALFQSGDVALITKDGDIVCDVGEKDGEINHRHDHGQITAGFNQAQLGLEGEPNVDRGRANPDSVINKLHRGIVVEHGNISHPLENQAAGVNYNVPEKQFAAEPGLDGENGDFQPKGSDEQRLVVI